MTYISIKGLLFGLMQKFVPLLPLGGVVSQNRTVTNFTCITSISHLKGDILTRSLKEISSWLVVFCDFYDILKMAENKEHFRHIMLYYFRKGKNASQTQKKICAVYGDMRCMSLRRVKHNMPKMLLIFCHFQNVIKVTKYNQSRRNLF